MRLPAAKTNDTLDATSLPPTDHTELNYRTRPITAEQENRLTNRTIFSPALLVAPSALVLSWIFPAQTLVIAFLIAAAAALLIAALIALVKGRTPVMELLGFAVIVTAGSLGALFHSLPSQRFAYGLFFPLVVVGVGAFSLIVAKQFAFWMANHPKVEWATARTWEGFFPALSWPSIPQACPEVRTVWLSPLFAAIAYVVGWLILLRVEDTAFFEYAAVWGIAGFAVVLVIELLAWNWGSKEAFSPFFICRVSWLGLRVWCSYNPHENKAAGVFRFPTASVRSLANRSRLTQATLVLLTAGIVSCLPPFLPLDRPDPDAPQGPYILPHEEEFLASLPEQDARERRRALLLQRLPRPKVAKPFTETVGVAAVRLLIAAGLLTAGTYLLLILILVATTGAILTRYYIALESENGFEQSKASAWDVYVNRIIESADALEKQHYLLGFSVFGDYPVLLHKEILDQHYHMTGDTGASKSSLGIAPLATQMIARGDCSVVIIDLKGDMALFETARLEAEREGREFRWFASEPGKTSHIFNPFLQSHLSMLTPEQRTESLLQAMSLDYGAGYGKSYFTAMNEVVLKNLLKAYNIRSFKELEGYLGDIASYKDLGEKKDFEQARHLAAIVNRLAGMTPLNLGMGKSSEQQAASERAIDAMDVLHRPQVLYFFLSSPQEPIGAPSVAKLFLWALFAAAARKPTLRNRVYVFVDEFQQIISDSVKLIFEQIRGQGVTMVIAHQTGGQLKRQGTDLSETIDSCTAVKQVFRASDLTTVKKLEESSGQAIYHTLSWTQPFDSDAPEDELEGQLAYQRSEESLLDVSEMVGPRLDRNTIIQLSAHPLASFVRFTAGKGYTQFGGFTTPIVSMFMMTEDQYQKRQKATWPPGQGTVLVPYPSSSESISRVPAVTAEEDDDDEDLDERLRRGMLS